MDSSDDDGRRAERGRRPAHDNMKSCATHLDRAKASRLTEPSPGVHQRGVTAGVMTGIGSLGMGQR